MSTADITPGSIFTICNCNNDYSVNNGINVCDTLQNFTEFRGYLHFEGPRFLALPTHSNNASVLNNTPTYHFNASANAYAYNLLNFRQSVDTYNGDGDGGHLRFRNGSVRNDAFTHLYKR